MEPIPQTSLDETRAPTLIALQTLNTKPHGQPRQRECGGHSACLQQRDPWANSGGIITENMINKTAAPPCHRPERGRARRSSLQNAWASNTASPPTSVSSDFFTDKNPLYFGWFEDRFHFSIKLSVSQAKVLQLLKITFNISFLI